MHCTDEGSTDEADCQEPVQQDGCHRHHSDATLFQTPHELYATLSFYVLKGRNRVETLQRAGHSCIVESRMHDHASDLLAYTATRHVEFD